MREKDIHKYVDKKVIMQENKYTNSFNRTDIKGGAFYNVKRIYEGNGIPVKEQTSNGITDSAVDKILNVGVNGGAPPLVEKIKTALSNNN